MALHLLFITALTIAAILVVQIIFAESVRGKGLSDRMGTGMARGFSIGMGIMWASDDQTLFSISSVFTQLGLGATVTQCAVEVCYMMLIMALGSALWLLVRRRYSQDSLSHD